ncbi:hypothetical protein PR202_ga19651 [Eleusine coracana subsp. coracana]|uniref:Knottins-like domain-containing protein n=1 Tax=Eleusine coracana subsp. coracana TaxID=191504 RepID=A0AAV5CV35_ELECO|nr:hypothetical protein PR202_ga19651 [Eleusine coracana subsp. coracana]
MASISRRTVASVLFFVLLLLASEMGTMKVAEARDCVSQSHRFKGGCVSSNNCHHVCQTEGFPSGECRVHFFRRKCYCKKFC